MYLLCFKVQYLFIFLHLAKNAITEHYTVKQNVKCFLIMEKIISQRIDPDTGSTRILFI